MSIQLDSKIPTGPLDQKWTKHKMDSKLINPANKRKFNIIVVGSGLAGGAAAASLAEMGYQVKCFCYQDSPRRAHSIAAQGGINAAKNSRTMATPCVVSSTTPSRVVTSVLVRPTFTASLRSPTPSSTNAWPKACPSLANTVAF